MNIQLQGIRHIDIQSVITALKRKKSCFIAISEMLYLTAASLYILKQSFSGTLFHIPWPENFEIIIRGAILAAAVIRLIYALMYARKKLLVGFLTCAMFCISWLSTGYIFLLDTALLIIGAVGMPYRKILKTGFWTGLYVLLLALLGSLVGCIPDRIYASEPLRHAFGIAYPTDFAAHVTFLVLIGWVLYGGRRFMCPFICSVLSAVFVLYYCQAKCSTIVLGLLAIGIPYYVLTEAFRERFKIVPLLTKLEDTLLPHVLPFCAVLMIGLTYFFNTENIVWNRINEILSSRLNLGHAAMDKYGVSLFGTAFEQTGYGGGTAWSFALEYNFVDSSYVLILIRYGLAVLLAVCIQYIWTERRALRNGHRKLALAAAFIAVHSMIEHHLPELAYNLFLLLPFASFAPKRQETCEIHEKKDLSRRTYAVYTAIAAGAAVIIMTFPLSVVYIKTIVDVLGLDNPKRHLLFMGAATLALSVAALFLYLFSKLAAAFIHKAPLPRKACIGLGALCPAIFIAVIQGELVIRHAQAEYRDFIEADRPAIEALLNGGKNGGRLYIDHIPEIYQREFNDIKGMVFPPESRARDKDTTMIVEDDGELLYPIEAGYVYGVLPSGHAVYTNSEAAEKILENTGIPLTTYYSRQQAVDLKEAALRNNLTLTKSGALLLDGYYNSLWHGSGSTIYHGMLRVEFRLRLVEYALSEGTAASVKISSDWGALTWNQADIALEDFDENGECTYIIDTNLTANCPNMEFLLIVPDGVKMEVLEIRYGKVGM